MKHDRSRGWFEKGYIILALLLCLSPCGIAAGSNGFSHHPHSSSKPLIGERYSNDRDANGVEDQLERRLEKTMRDAEKAVLPPDKEKIRRQLDEIIEVELIFKEPIANTHLKKFELLGGQVDYIYKAVSYGWNGRIPLQKVRLLPEVMGSEFVLVQQTREIEAHLDIATRNGRVRPVWAPGFAGSTSGFKGSDNITIAIVDSGIDADHPDMAGRCVFWHDYTTDNSSVPVDKFHHGTHVAGIAAGTGVSAGSQTGTLYYTDRSITFLTYMPKGYFIPSPISLPDGQVVFSSTASWYGGAPTSLYLFSKPKGVRLDSNVNNSLWTALSAPATGYSPLQESNTFTASSDLIYTPALAANYVDAQHVVGRFAMVNSITNYPGSGDGFNRLSGIAPECRLAASKVFTNSGSGYTNWLESAIDDLVANRIEQNIKVINLSLGIIGDPGLSPSLRQKINTAVANGILVVISAGNGGEGATAAERVVDDPGRAAYALTVAASNDENQLTDYSSQGFLDPNTTPGQEEDYKPDITAPGGSIYYTYIMSVDSGSGDGGSFVDQQPNDYMQMRGTSMASPFAAGCAALVIDALEQNGKVWDFNSPADPFFVKMILCATASETNSPRENGLYSPTLERAAQGPGGFPAGKDLNEGYGLINADAAVEGLTCQYIVNSIESETLGSGPYDKRVWARRIFIPAGLMFEPTLLVPSGGDYDLYLYSFQPGLYGRPVIAASSTNVGQGFIESFIYQPQTDFVGLLAVKRVSGAGEFILTPQKTLTLSSTNGGTIMDPGIGVFRYNKSDSVDVTAVADGGYHFVEWTGSAADAGKVQNPYSASTTITVDDNYTAIANFAVNIYTLTVTAGDHGSVDPNGVLALAYGSSQLFTAAPDEGYTVDSWSIDGEIVQSGGLTYALENITADHVVLVTFHPVNVTVSASAGDYGSVDPNGVLTLAYGSSQLFTAAPDEGYTVDSWTVDGTEVQS
ncbi:MAG TPA: S8 family serine peptidase, partial [Anaerohalosphaeraceae bacterium]|nr:S8 family serine peptidase [Anaerohalosphaeraceae bacterium]